MGLHGFDPLVPIVVDGRPVLIEDLTPDQRERIVRDRANPPPAARPTSLAVDTTTGESAATIPVGASFGDVRVLAHYDGIDEPRNVSRVATLRVGPEPIAAIRNRQVVGLRPGRGFVEAQFGGLTSDPT